MSEGLNLYVLSAWSVGVPLRIWSARTMVGPCVIVGVPIAVGLPITVGLRISAIASLLEPRTTGMKCWQYCQRHNGGWYISHLL